MGIPFGRNGCSTIEVEPFRKICDFARPEGTTPLELEVPVTSFANPVPPAECACFDFKSGSSKVNVITDTAKQKLARASVEIRQRDPDCCTGRYEIIPLVEIPACTLPDTQSLCTKKVELDNRGSYIQATLTRQNCDIGLVLSGQVNHPSFPQPCIPTLKTGTFDLTVNYEDDQGTQETATAQFNVKNNADPGECPEYEIEGATLNLGAIGGSGFASGGDVNKNSKNKRLYIDTGLDTHGYYGGGYGDSGSGAYTGVNRRDDRMRGAASAFGSIDVPVTAVASKLVDANGNTKLTWTSGITVAEDGTETSDGNLDIVMPTGVEWNRYGMAFTLSKFKYAPNGVLNSVTETEMATLVSPAPAVRVTGSASRVNADNVSGLEIYPDDATELGGAGVACGIAVNAGDGLRIHGVNGKTPGTLWEENVGQLEVQFGDGLHVLKGYNTTTGAAVYDEARSDAVGALSVACGDGLTIDSNGRVALDDDSLAKKHHTHALSDGSSETETKKWEITGSDKYSLVFVDNNGKAATKVGAYVYDLHQLAAIYNATTFYKSTTTGGLSDGYLKTLELKINSSTSGIGLDGTNTAITFKGSTATESDIYARDTGLTLYSKMKVILESTLGDTELNKKPSATSTDKTSKSVATCGWVADNFMPTSGFSENRWVMTDKDGHLDTTGESDTGVLCAEGGIRKILPIGDVDADTGVGIAGLVADGDKAVVPYDNIPTGDNEENKVATGKHTHGQLQTDGTVSAGDDGKTVATAGNLLVADADDGSKLKVFSGFDADWVEDMDDTTALSFIVSAFNLQTSGEGEVELRLPTSRLTFDSDEEHENNCLLAVDSAGDIHHSGNEMYDTLEVLAPAVGATGDARLAYPVLYEDGGETTPTYKGLTRAAFGGAGTTESATVVFKKAENGEGTVATLLDGMPVTVPSDKEGVVYDYKGECVIAKSGTGITVDVTPGSETTPSTAEVKVNFGRGLHATSCSETAKDNNDKLEIHANDTDFAFLGSAVSAITNAQLSINDEGRGASVLPDAPAATSAAAYNWYRRVGVPGTTANEIVIPVVIDVSIVDGVATKKFVYLRFMRNGVLLGVHAEANYAAALVGGRTINFEAGRSTQQHVTACGT